MELIGYLHKSQHNTITVDVIKAKLPNNLLPQQHHGIIPDNFILKGYVLGLDVCQPV